MVRTPLEFQYQMKLCNDVSSRKFRRLSSLYFYRYRSAILNNHAKGPLVRGL
jgi:hypothetical protein